jgi:hypothetical protein
MGRSMGQRGGQGQGRSGGYGKSRLVRLRWERWLGLGARVGGVAFVIKPFAIA